MVSSSTAQALADIANRASDVMRAFMPGAVSTHNDTNGDAASRYSSDSLTASAPANAYFVGTDERGRQMYTRDGEFRFVNGTIVDRFGQPLLGHIGSKSALMPLRADGVDVALGRMKNLHVEEDGSVTYTRVLIEPRTGVAHNTRVLLGRLALARFPAGSQLLPHDATRMFAPQGVVPHIGVAGDGNFERVRPHVREGSRLSIDDSIEKLREAYTAFEAIHSAQTAQGKAEKIMMDLLK